MMEFTKIVSGGQTGADRAALDFALDFGIEHGGWCPKGRLAEDGVIPHKYKMQEMPSSEYRHRTKQNVIDSDGTLIVNLGDLDGGTLATLKFVQERNKPHLVIKLDRGILKEDTDAVCSWLQKTSIATLNVAGPRGSKWPEIYDLTYELLVSCLD